MSAQSFLRIVATAVVCGLPVGCGSGEEEWPTPTVTITNPTSSGTWTTNASGLIVGGEASHTSNVDVLVVETGMTFRGGVVYNNGIGTWFATVLGLQLGQNTLIATTVDSGNTGGKTASTQLIVTRVP